MSQLLLPSEKKQITVDEYLASLAGPREDYGKSYRRKSDDDTSVNISLDMFSDPAVNVAELSVRIPISTNDLDRANDVVVQSGITLSEYETNPVVLYEHGMEDVTVPVAISESAEGVLSIEVSDTITYATAYHKANKASMQMFGLVVDKFIRAASIAFEPIMVAKGMTSNGDPVHFIESCMLHEWSYVKIPCNQYAVKRYKNLEKLKEYLHLQCEAASRILNRGTIDGSLLLPAISKSLRQTLSENTTVTTKGIEKDVVMKKIIKADLKKLTAKQFMGVLAEKSEYDPESQKAIDEVVAEKMEEEEDVPVETKEEPVDQTPLGATVVRALHQQLLSILTAAKTALGPVEAPDVKEQVTGLISEVETVVNSLEGIFSSKYADLPQLKMADEEEPSEDAMKSFFAGSITGRNTVKAYSARLKHVVDSVKNGAIGPESLKLLARTATDVATLADKVDSYKFDDASIRKSVATEIRAVYEKKLDEAAKKLNEFAEKIESSPEPVDMG